MMREGKNHSFLPMKERVVRHSFGCQTRAGRLPQQRSTACHPLIGEIGRADHLKREGNIRRLLPEDIVDLHLKTKVTSQRACTVSVPL